MFGWTIGILFAAAAALAVGLGSIAAVTAENALLLCGALVLLFIAALIAFASSGSSQS